MDAKQQAEYFNELQKIAVEKPIGNTSVAD